MLSKQQGNSEDNMNVLLLAQTVLKAKPMYQKMKDDSANKLAHTLSVMRACRIFNYLFLASTAYDSLLVELENLQLLAGLQEDTRNKMKQEFHLYKSKSVHEVAQEHPLNLWGIFLLSISS